MKYVGLKVVIETRKLKVCANMQQSAFSALRPLPRPVSGWDYRYRTVGKKNQIPLLPLISLPAGNAHISAFFIIHYIHNIPDITFQYYPPHTLMQWANVYFTVHRYISLMKKD